MTTNLRNTWTIKTPHPEDYVDYLNLVRNTGHQLEDVAFFNCKVVRARDSSHHDKSDDRHAFTKKQRKERKDSTCRNPKLTNPALQSFRRPESEHALAQKDRAQTLIEHRIQLNQYSHCGDPNHFWCKCPAATSVVALAKPNGKQTFNEAQHSHCTLIPKPRCIEAPPLTV